MINFLLLHGIHTQDNESAFHNRFKRVVKRFGDPKNIMAPYLGYIRFFQARYKSKRIAKKLLPEIKENTVAICHSNGALVLWYLCKMGVKFEGVILLNPALNRRKRFNANWINIYYTEFDFPIFISQLFLFHHWGAMGRKGPSYYDKNLNSFDMANTLYMPVIKTHNQIYKDVRMMRVWGCHVVSEANKEIKVNSYEQENIDCRDSRIIVSNFPKRKSKKNWRRKSKR